MKLFAFFHQQIVMRRRYIQFLLTGFCMIQLAAPLNAIAETACFGDRILKGPLVAESGLYFRTLSSSSNVRFQEKRTFSLWLPKTGCRVISRAK